MEKGLIGRPGLEIVIGVKIHSWNGADKLYGISREHIYWGDIVMTSNSKWELVIGFGEQEVEYNNRRGVYTLNFPQESSENSEELCLNRRGISNFDGRINWRNKDSSSNITSENADFEKYSSWLKIAEEMMKKNN